MKAVEVVVVVVKAVEVVVVVVKAVDELLFRRDVTRAAICWQRKAKRLKNWDKPGCKAVCSIHCISCFCPSKKGESRKIIF